MLLPWNLQKRSELRVSFSRFTALMPKSEALALPSVSFGATWIQPRGAFHYNLQTTWPLKVDTNDKPNFVSVWSSFCFSVQMLNFSQKWHKVKRAILLLSLR